MYKPKKPDDQASLSKIKLNTQSGMPSSSQVKDMLTEAQNKKGVSIEQPWTTSQHGQSFILIVRWGPTDSTPIWTLYEESAGQSKMHWSQPFEPNDFSMMYDVICMSVPDSGSSVKIPDALKAKDPTEKSGGSSGSSGMPPKPSAGPDLFPGGAAPPAMPYPGGAPPAPYPPGGGFPPYPAGGSQAPYPAPGGYPAPSPYPPANPQAAPYNSPLNAPSPWQQGFGAPPNQAPPQPAYLPQQSPAPGYSQAPAPSSYPSSSPSFTPTPQISPADSPKIPIVDYGLLSQRANILLGELLFEAGLITEPSLEAALKIQEYVREERMSPGQAGEVLKKHHTLGGSIDNYLTPDDFDLDASRGGARPKQSYNSALASASAVQQAAKSGAPGTKAGGGSKPGAGGGSAGDAGKSDRARLQLAAMDLLQKAGILKADDVQLAHGVYKKVGGDLPQILTSAGKLDGTTYKAAEVCIPLIKEGKMKVEQCIIALNYCSRSRVDFDSALDELGWENPRKKK